MFDLPRENAVKTYTREQLERVYNRLLGRVERDMFGVDWRTLYIVNRGLYNSLKRVMHLLDDTKE